MSAPIAALRLRNAGPPPPAISSDKPSIGGAGYNLSDTATITATGGRTISSIVLIAGAPGGRVTLGGTGGPSTTINITTPGSGTGSVSGTYRVTCSTSEFVDVDFAADWGV